MTKTRNIYYLPFANNVLVEKVVSDSPAHFPPYDKALDFAIPTGSEVLAPLGGEVISVVDKHSKFGPTKEFSPYCNYIQIQHLNGEMSELIHLQKDSAVVRVGEKVKTGQVLAVTGNSGWMTAPHLHWMVSRRSKNKHGFTGLAINLES